MRRHVRVCVLALLCCAVPGLGRDAHAQLPADAAFSTIESTHFRVTFARGLEDLARHAVASAERAHAALSTLVADAPAGRIDIVVADNVDFSNGYATPFPSNRIVIYARPPADMLELQYVHDWIDLLVTHELAHIFHLDVAGSVGRLVRGVFGRVPFGWPVFPAVGSPLWSVEGLAVTMESLPGFGRVHGSYHDMVVRTAALEDEMDSIDRLTSTSPEWPGVARVYIYGSLFSDYLARRYGADAAARVVRATAGSLVPAPLWFGRIGRTALGVSFRDAYEQWRAEVTTQAEQLRAQLEAERITVSEPLTTHRAFAVHPRYSPDGRMIAYAANDGRSVPRTRVIDVATGEEVFAERRNDNAPASWLPDGRLLTTWIDHVDRFRIYGDAWIIGPDGAQRVTRAARLQNVDAARDGSAVAIENGGGTNRIVLLDTGTGAVAPITDADPDTHWSLPRFDPAGRRIAAGRWQTGGNYDIVVMDTAGRMLNTIMAGGISAAPAWSPDGEWVLFWSDRTGIPNIYASRADGSELRQVTNVLTGAFYPDVSPDASSIAFSAYHHEGFRIERIPFDPALWRAPMDERADGPEAPREVFADAGTVLDSARSAVEDADTVAGGTDPYRPLRHMRPYYWLPEFRSGGYEETLLGIRVGGQDLVQRHSWNLGLAVAPSSRRIEGDVAYTYRGLPVLTRLGLHPAATIFMRRDWDSLVEPEDEGDPYVDERDDVAGLTLDLAHTRWRAVSGLAVTGELVRRSRSLHDAADLRLRDPADDLVGMRARAYYANASRPPYAISAENGVTLQIAGLQRVDRSAFSALIDGQNVDFDGSYSEVSSWNAAYRALPLGGFARHVLAARASGLFRAGPGASLSSIGGISAAGVNTYTLAGAVGGSSAFLPVRGFDAGARRGSRAWTASAEYRLPVALVSRSLRPLPIFFDRLAVSTFADAGHAWCAADVATRFASSCRSTSATASPLIGAGGEIAAFLSIYGVGVPLRLTVAAPVRRDAGDDDGVRFYLTAGSWF